MTLNRNLTQELVLERVFNAPRELVFKVWTESEHVAKWWGPALFTNPVCEMDARPGGAIRIDMHGPDGSVAPMTGVFHEVIPPERLVFTSRAFEDSSGNAPLEVLNTITFEDYEGKTKIKLVAQVIKAAPEMAAALAGMEEGWQGSLDKLSDYLEQASGNKVKSKDGTFIAFDRTGHGPAVILISGALGVRRHPMFTELAELLSERLTVINYDRRGRGDSGNTLPYSVEREIDDIDALIDTAGGSASLYGISSGAALALEAANRLPHKVKKLALYEPPFIVDDSHPPLPKDYVQQIQQMTDANRPGDAVALFMKVVGVPEEFIPQMREDPMWAEMEKVAPTLAYDGTIMGDNQSGKPLAPGQWPDVQAHTLVILGGESEPFFQNGAQALIEQLPAARLTTLPGQGHDVSSSALAPLLAEFFTAQP